jgi:hypothetical protein
VVAPMNREAVSGWRLADGLIRCCVLLLPGIVTGKEDRSSERVAPHGVLTIRYPLSAIR